MAIPFSATLKTANRSRVEIVLTGEFDIAASPLFEEICVVEEFLDSIGAPEMVLDLTRVTFCGGEGVGQFIRLYRMRCEQKELADPRITLLYSKPTTIRAIELTGMAWCFHLTPVSAVPA